MIHSRLHQILIGIFCFGLSGCGKVSDRELVYRQDVLVNNALKDLPLLASFKSRYPHSEHFISYVTGENGRTTWNSKALLFGRYILHMTAPAIIDRKSLKVSLEGEPAFQLREVTSITPLPDGRQQAFYGKTVKFSADDWRRVEASEGDFGVLGIQLKKDKPVPGFTDFVKY
jgi:hypothetical protein